MKKSRSYRFDTSGINMPITVLLLKEFFDLPVNSRHDLEIVALSSGLSFFDNSFRRRGYPENILELFSQVFADTHDVNSLEFQSLVFYRLALYQRLSEMSPRQRIWISKLVKRLKPIDLICRSNDTLDSIKIQGSHLSILDQLKERFEFYVGDQDRASDMAKNLEEIPCDWENHWLIAIFALPSLLTIIPRVLLKEWNNQVARLYCDFVTRVKNNLSEYQSQVDKVEVRLLRHAIRKFDACVNDKGRVSPAKSIRDVLFEASAIIGADPAEELLSNWGLSCTKNFNINRFGICDEIIWSSRRARYFGETVIQILNDRESNLESLNANIISSTPRGRLLEYYCHSTATKAPSFKLLEQTAIALEVPIKHLWLFSPDELG